MLICGLGNPEEKYHQTRHNFGFLLIDQIVKDYNFQYKSSSFGAELFQGEIAGRKILLCKPMNFMNNSGSPIAKIKNFFKIELSDIFVCHDDFDLELERIKVKNGGGDGGHNGLKSIDQSIGKNYHRLRLGVRSENDKFKAINHVLQQFSKAEMTEVAIVIDKISKNFHLLFEEREKFLNEFYKISQ
jgi:PTH1 family peptidyl-tRNA hydrolase